jgi:hypothetical protein
MTEDQETQADQIQQTLGVQNHSLLSWTNDIKKSGPHLRMQYVFTFTITNGNKKSKQDIGLMLNDHPSTIKNVVPVYLSGSIKCMQLTGSPEPKRRGDI